MEVKISNNFDDVKCDQQSEEENHEWIMNEEHEFEEIETVGLWKQSVNSPEGII